MRKQRRRSTEDSTEVVPGSSVPAVMVMSVVPPARLPSPIRVVPSYRETVPVAAAGTTVAVTVPVVP